MTSIPTSTDQPYAWTPSPELIEQKLKIGMKRFNSFNDGRSANRATTWKEAQQY